jgi:hypothetical protein
MSAAAAAALVDTADVAESCGLFTIRSLILELFRQSPDRAVRAVRAVQKPVAA